MKYSIPRIPRCDFVTHTLSKLLRTLGNASCGACCPRLARSPRPFSTSRELFQCSRGQTACNKTASESHMLTKIAFNAFRSQHAKVFLPIPCVRRRGGSGYGTPSARPRFQRTAYYIKLSGRMPQNHPFKNLHGALSRGLGGQRVWKFPRLKLPFIHPACVWNFETSKTSKQEKKHK